MADRLAKVYGTEMDKVNCPFYYKIGACRYGDSCQRIHNKPPISQTVCLQHMYENNAIQTALIDGHNVSSADAQAAMTKYQNFFQQVFKEMMKYGQIQDMIVVDNLGDHIVGNIYVKYSQQQYSQNAQKNINGRFFNGKKIDAQFSPVTDFLNAKCKQYIDGSCKRGGYCNYMHIKPLSKSFKRDLFTQMYLQFPEYREKKVDSDSSSDNNWKKSQNKDRKQKKHKSKKDRSRSRQKKQKKQKKKKRKRSSSQSSKNSQEIMQQIAKWNKQFYDQ